MNKLWLPVEGILATNYNDIQLGMFEVRDYILFMALHPGQKQCAWIKQPITLGRICSLPDQNVDSGGAFTWTLSAQSSAMSPLSNSISQRIASSAKSVLAFSLTSGKHCDKYLPKWVGSCAWMALRKAAEGSQIWLTQTLWVILLKIITQKARASPFALLQQERGSLKIHTIHGRSGGACTATVAHTHARACTCTTGN